MNYSGVEANSPHAVSDVANERARVEQLSLPLLTNVLSDFRRITLFSLTITVQTSNKYRLAV